MTGDNRSALALTVQVEQDGGAGVLGEVRVARLAAELVHQMFALQVGDGQLVAHDAVRALGERRVHQSAVLQPDERDARLHCGGRNRTNRINQIVAQIDRSFNLSIKCEPYQLRSRR